MVGKVALKKTLGILAGPIGWVITGALVSVNLAGPAYRVTVPACVLVATLRKKLKAEQETKLKAEQAEQETKLKAEQAEQEADEKKMWYLVIVFCILIGLAVLAVFSSKENTIQAMTQAITQKAVLKTLKTLATRIKEWQHRSN
ncbi:hypothetical protein HpM018_01920 [Helicobacter pylori]